MFNIGKEQVMGGLRHVLTAAGPLIASHGYASDAEVQTVGGALITIIGFAWSLFAPEKVEAKKARKG